MAVASSPLGFYFDLHLHYCTYSELSSQSPRFGLMALLLKLLRTDVSRRRVRALAVVPDGDPLKERRSHSAGEAKDVRYTSSRFTDAKKLSAGALSQQLPLRLMLQTTPARIGLKSCYSSAKRRLGWRLCQSAYPLRETCRTRYKAAPRNCPGRCWMNWYLAAGEQ